MRGIEKGKDNGLKKKNNRSNIAKKGNKENKSYRIKRKLKYRNFNEKIQIEMSQNQGYFDWTQSRH